MGFREYTWNSVALQAISYKIPIIQDNSPISLSQLAYPKSGTSIRVRTFPSRHFGNMTMLGYALIFLLLALVAGYLGFFGLAGVAASIAKILLVIFVILLIVSAFSGAVRGRPPI